MKRIVFLDYVRVFACFLVMVVHASENFYGAAGSTDMAGPQSYLANEADRLWVAVYDGFSRMAVPLFMIVSAYLLVPMKEGQTSWQFYHRRFTHILPPFFIFMILYSTLPMLWGQLDGETSLKDLSRILLNFPTLKPRRKKNVSSLDCSCYQHVCRTLTAGLVKCGDNVSGMNTTCYGTSQVSLDILYWHIIYVYI